jgi:hypothetical protein
VNGLVIDHTVGKSLSVRDGEVELFSYIYAPDTVQLEAPKPYIHPVRTRGGRTVSLFRPHDHVWHKGIAWSLPHLGDQNFWGGPTYVHGSFYVQLDNNGAQRHRRMIGLGSDGGGIAMSHELDWITQADAPYFTERRTLRARILSETAWALIFETEMTNVSGGAVSVGSPTTKGRENAGYGGLFWRGPRSFTGGRLVSPSGAGGEELRGQREPWMAYVGVHDDTTATSTVLMVDDAANPHHPPQWFARTVEFACLNPAPFFSQELEIADGETVTFRYGVGIADGDDDVSGVAEAVTAAMASANRVVPEAVG